jgi:hypothetical protein
MSTYGTYESRGRFGALPLYTLVPGGAALLLFYGYKSIERVSKCIKRLDANNDDGDSDKKQKLLSQLEVYSAIMGFNIGVLLITLIPIGIIRVTSFLTFASLLLWVIGQSIYYVNKIEDTSNEDCPDNYTTIKPLKSLLYGYLGGAIGIFIGLGMVKGMAGFGIATQLRIILIIVIVQLIAVNIFSIGTYRECKNGIYKSESKDDVEEIKTLDRFYQQQLWPIGISTLVILVVLGSFYYERKGPDTVAPTTVAPTA